MRASVLLDLLGLAADPRQLAIIDHGVELSRGEVLERVIARAELVRDLTPEDCRVAFRDTQDHHAIVNILAVMMAGRSIAMIGHDGDALAAAATAARCAILLDGDQPIVAHWPLSKDPLHLPHFGATEVGSPEAVVLYTSGTTSEPRGVRLSQRSILCNLTAMLRFTPSWSEDSRFGLVLSLTHSFGLSMTLMSLARRAPIVILGGGPPSRSTVEMVAELGVTVLACVPYYLRLLQTRRLSIGSTFAPALRSIFLAGGGIPDRELDAVLTDFDGERYLMYGFTEATARVAVRRGGDRAPENSVGVPLPGSYLEIVSGEGKVLPVGEIGRIRVSSPSLMIGYLGEEPRVQGTPFTTTDLGRVDEYGNVFVTGREAEMLNFRGNRISVTAVEASVVAIDGVQDARLIPDSRDEDAQCGLHVVASAEADHAQVRRLILRVVEPRGLVRRVEFVDRLEFTRSGKPLRRA